MKKLLMIFTIIFILLLPCSIYASAGGGSAGGGGSGGGSGSGSGGTHSSSTNNSPVQNTIQLIVVGTTGIIVTHFAIIARFKRTMSLHTKNLSVIKEFAKSDPLWNIDHLKDRVTEVFYATQDAWTHQDEEEFKPYLTNELYDNWCTKIRWQVFQHRRNVLDRVRLINMCFVNVYDDEDNDYDYFCVYIQARMIDYMIDQDSQADRPIKPGMLYEYWYFKRIDDEFYLDEIKQVDEVNI